MAVGARQASLSLGWGFLQVRGSGSGVGEYRLLLGSYGEQHPISDGGGCLLQLSRTEAAH
jgi:hypothetical protein